MIGSKTWRFFVLYRVRYITTLTQYDEIIQDFSEKKSRR